MAQPSRRMFHLRLSHLPNRPAVLPVLAVFTDSSLEERFKLEDICGILGTHLPRSLGGEAAEPKAKSGAGAAGAGSKAGKGATLTIKMPGDLERVLAATLPRKDKAGLYNGPYFTMGFYLQDSMRGPGSTSTSAGATGSLGSAGGHYAVMAPLQSEGSGAAGDGSGGALAFQSFRPTECVLKVRLSPRDEGEGDAEATDGPPAQATTSVADLAGGKKAKAAKAPSKKAAGAGSTGGGKKRKADD